MGSWNVSINGNDTAADLRSEYTCAFYYYKDINEALKRIDEYVRKHVCDESDEEEWCNYFYSLADFMWKKGILTEEIKNQTIKMIDDDFGLDLWAEAGEKTLIKRKNELEKFRQKLLSPMPPKKKIKPNVHTVNVFNNGDLIAIKLITKNKPYATSAACHRKMSQEEFESYDGKYVLIQKESSKADWRSSIVPEICDYWVIFILYDGIYDDIPENIDINKLKEANLHTYREITPLFLCESSMFHFKKRDYKVIGNFPVNEKKYENKALNSLFFGINRDYLNPDSTILSAMGKEIIIEKFNDSSEILKEIAKKANRYGAYNYSRTREQNEQDREEEEKIIFENIDNTLNCGGEFYVLNFGVPLGIISITNGKIDNFYVVGMYQKNGFGTMLLKEVLKHIDKPYAIIPEIRNKERVVHIFKKEGVEILT